MGFHQTQSTFRAHDDVIKWKHFPRYWPFVKGIHRSPVDSPNKGPWRGALMFSLMRAWTNGWANSRYPGDLRHHGAHCNVTEMSWAINGSSVYNGTVEYIVERGEFLTSLYKDTHSKLVRFVKYTSSIVDRQSGSLRQRLFHGKAPPLHETGSISREPDCAVTLLGFQ